MVDEPTSLGVAGD